MKYELQKSYWIILSQIDVYLNKNAIRSKYVVSENTDQLYNLTETETQILVVLFSLKWRNILNVLDVACIFYIYTQCVHHCTLNDGVVAFFCVEISVSEPEL